MSRRIREGVKLLDKLSPGWENRINLKTLRMSSCKECILGQLYGSYSTGRQAVFTHISEPRRFSPTTAGFTAKLDETFESLNKLWVEEIFRRRYKGTRP